MSEPRRPGIPRVAWALALLAAGGLLALGVGHLRRDPGDEDRDQGTSPALSHVTTEDGHVVVTLASEAAARADVRTQPLEAMSYRRTVRGYGTVVDLRDLLALRDRFVAAKGQATAARARADASGRELERVRGLYQNDRNMSAKELESARAAASVDRAQEQASAAPVRALAAEARQDFGPVLGGWVTAGSLVLDRIVAGKAVLVRVALPPDVVPAAPPPRATLLVDGTPRVSAQFVSPAARTDPQIQGLSLYYRAGAHQGLVAHRNVVALLPLGRATKGVRIPEAAVVWTKGSAWVYVAPAKDRYVRKAIRTDRPVDGGYVVTDLSPGTEVVVRGAELLLSEEFRAAHPKRAEEEDED